jgi:uncharacterized membrane protein
MNSYVPPTVLGVANGLRSLLPLAVLALSSPATIEDPVLRVVTRPPVPIVLALAAGGELIADKLPNTPSRLSPLGLASRLVMYGRARGNAGRSDRRHFAPLSAACGVVGAAAGAWTGDNVRHQRGVTTGLPDPHFAVLEDAVSVTLALWSARAALDQPLSAPIVRPRMK